MQTHPDEVDLAPYVNLASPRLGASVEAASDAFFGDAARLIHEADPVFVPGRYDANGKWMDGWETRRRRGPGHDWCLVRLGVAGRVAFVEVDTRHFTGNYPPAAAVEGCADDPPYAASRWLTLVPSSPLGPDQRHLFASAEAGPVRWLRLAIHPDGGVARLRAYGTPAVDATAFDGEAELSALKHGGRILGLSDAHYGTPSVILTEGRGRDMGDGWETRRRREPGHDWMVIALGLPGRVTRLEVDTAHYKGNFPDKVSVQAGDVEGGSDRSIVTQSMFWPDLLAPTPLLADHLHVFGADALAAPGPATHVRLSIHPDGGVSRFRVFGHVRP